MPLVNNVGKWSEVHSVSPITQGVVILRPVRRRQIELNQAVLRLSRLSRHEWEVPNQLHMKFHPQSSKTSLPVQGGAERDQFHLLNLSHSHWSVVTEHHKVPQEDLHGSLLLPLCLQIITKPNPSILMRTQIRSNLRVLPTPQPKTFPSSNNNKLRLIPVID